MFYQIKLPIFWALQGSLPQFNPDTDVVSDSKFNIWLHEDMWQAMSPDGHFVIDVGWYPAGDRQGEFIARLIQDEKWDDSREILQTSELIHVSLGFKLW